MKALKSHTILPCLIVMLFLLTASIAFSEPSKEVTDKTRIGGIHIRSNTLEMNNKLKRITFSGDVNASKDEFDIHCDKMVGYGVGMPHEQAGAEKAPQYEKIVATGNVIIRRAESGDATAEEAIYYQEEEKIVLTGNPVVKQDNDVVKGGRIIIFLKEDRVVVEDPTGTIAPRDEER